MLDDDERRILADLEREFQEPVERPFPTIPVLCVLLFLAFPLVMLLFGWPGLVITFDLFAASVAIVLLRRRCR
ncbi:DUF3040 domain-containing protein [Actinoplanes aureus]|jgi:hypothetical protein|uniref:DUF3040 domain-containing protein n=1 Tax=Actinoplanes aureus TaxID=2792083 RepID=A0A931C7S9_9ACTN|nr:DUF3040 domain-containing protein [Actinoplanes aureus]MBG0562521.1 DUF3040 domain-containing protein [Actinoplanes aureus]